MLAFAPSASSPRHPEQLQTKLSRECSSTRTTEGLVRQFDFYHRPVCGYSNESILALGKFCFMGGVGTG